MSVWEEGTVVNVNLWPPVVTLLSHELRRSKNNILCANRYRQFEAHKNRSTDNKQLTSHRFEFFTSYTTMTTTTSSTSGSTVKTTTFDSLGVKITGKLYLPATFDESKKFPTIIMAPPFPQVKGQALSNYGPKFADKGFVTLAFDWNSTGESETFSGGFRNDQNIPWKWEDVRNGISYLCSQSFVDTDKLYAVGMCGGGNIMSSVLITDLRVKKFATISAMLASDAFVLGDKDAFIARIKAANAVRQEMYETGKPVYKDAFGYTDPDFLEKNKNAPPGVLEGYDFYGTARGGTERYPNYTNCILGNIDETTSMNLGEHYADKMIQPFMGVVGSKAETAPCTKMFYDKVTSEKEYVVIEGASHVAMYDKPEYVNQAVDKITAFFEKV